VVDEVVIVVVCSVADTVKGRPSGRLVSMTSVVGMLEPPRLERTSEGTMDMGRGVARNVVAVVVAVGSFVPSPSNAVSTNVVDLPK
jgi:hypothetical protein